jgi:7,8-dihydropterin-6-yl-methyl-4-(beta-D-ribofuranosyl)aminobenzene 5'-phosphate synthase
MKRSQLKITIIYDNTAFDKRLIADWGFSCLIEIDGRIILFDTGAKGRILLDNMNKLNIIPAAIDFVFISHDHWDHTGGLPDFLNINSCRVYVPASFEDDHAGREVVKVKEPREIHDNIFSTGELANIEQSLVLNTEKGSVVAVGCSHPGVDKILNAASQFGKPIAVIGGLHGFDQYDLIEDLKLVCPTHCTQHISEIRSLYPEKYIQEGAGQLIDF